MKIKLRMVSPGGFIYYFQHGLLHREEGPAIITPEGDMFYYINGERRNKDITGVTSNGLAFLYVGTEAVGKSPNSGVIYTTDDLARLIQGIHDDG